MANKYYGAKLSAQIPNDVTIGDATTTLDVELVVNLAGSGINKNRVVTALEAIKLKVIENWPATGL